MSVGKSNTKEIMMQRAVAIQNIISEIRLSSHGVAHGIRLSSPM